MNKIKFFGAAGTVTGSCFRLVDKNGRALLIDLGMFLGPHKIEQLNHHPLDLGVNNLEGVILTHAHLDHCGRLPMLVKMGYKGKIFMTSTTLKLTELALFDAAKIAQIDNNKQIIYSAVDVEQLLSRCKVVEYGQEIAVGSFHVILRDAGHILGSASVEVVDSQSQKIVFSGDLGNSPQDIVRPTEIINNADIVVMESTYGDRLHPDGDPQTVIQEEINYAENKEQTLLIPAFSLQRTQQILHIIDHLKKEKKVRGDTKIFLDSPMGIKATSIYKHFREMYNKELLTHVAKDDPFDFPGLELTQSSKLSKKISKHKGSKVIIAGSGMMTGGRILHHGLRYLPRESTRLLIVGYQGEETLGRQILDGVKTVSILDRKILIKANIRVSNTMSAHADQNKLLTWLTNIQGSKKVFLVHGDEEPRISLSKKIKDALPNSSVLLPNLNDEFNL